MAVFLKYDGIKGESSAFNAGWISNQQVAAAKKGRPGRNDSDPGVTLVEASNRAAQAPQTWQSSGTDNRLGLTAKPPARGAPDSFFDITYEVGRFSATTTQGNQQDLASSQMATAFAAGGDSYASNYALQAPETEQAASSTNQLFLKKGERPTRSADVFFDIFVDVGRAENSTVQTNSTGVTNTQAAYAGDPIPDVDVTRTPRFGDGIRGARNEVVQAPATSQVSNSTNWIDLLV